MENFIRLFENSIKDNWEKSAIVECNGTVTTYHQLAEYIHNNHLLWKAYGLTPGDKIAICAKNSARYIELYASIVTGGYIAVLIPNNLSQEDILRLVDHSDSRIFYSDKAIIDSIDFNNASYDFVVENIKEDRLPISEKSADIVFRKAEVLTPVDVSYSIDDLESACSILYTSGSSGKPKGVMLSIKNISFEVAAVSGTLPYSRSDNYVSLLPFPHRFGLICDMICPLCMGMQIVINRKLVPSKVCLLLRKYQPHLICSVPAVLQHIIDYIIQDGEESQNFAWQKGFLLSNKDLLVHYRNKVLSYLGGKVEAYFTSGAPISTEFESFLVTMLKVPYISGYGMAECGFLSIGITGRYKLSSCGRLIDRRDVRIEENGEILIKDDGVSKGYYKDTDLTLSAYTKEGWFKSGDLGRCDASSNLFVTGRIKEMLLSSTGENIYPHNIESILNTMPFVQESIIVQRAERLHAIVVPDKYALSQFINNADAINDYIRDAVSRTNTKIPHFAIIDSFEIRDEPFERTEKGNYKRFLYK